jgi:aromatic-L-amino-acid/L-tryptophan decarboxylase
MERSNPLELSGDDMRALVELAMERIARHIDSLPTQPAAHVDGAAELARSLMEPLPERGSDFGGMLDLLFDRVVPVSFNTASPGYLAYVPGGGVLHTAVADLIADAVNRYVGVWIAAPGLVQLEANVIRWFCEIVGYPATAGGVLTTGGSMANLIALIAARRERLPEDFLEGVVYTSDQTHHSVQKAAVLAGFPARHVREIPTDEVFRIAPDALERAILEDRDAGLTPFLVTGSAGTTNTGSVDDLEALADLAERHGLWLHLDAAYGGFFMLTERGRQAMGGLARADSISLDPHKGLFLPYGNGALLFRDPHVLRRAHTTFADYMPPMQSEQDLVDFTQLSPELSRDFRGLRAWLPIKLAGIAAFRELLDEKIDLALWAADQLEQIPDVELLARPQLSTLAFRLAPAGLSRAEVNGLNRRVLDDINGRQRVYLTPTTLRGEFAIRICVLSFRTHLDRMEACLEDVRRAVEVARAAV